MFKRWLLLCCLMFAPHLLWAANANKQLQQFVDEVASARGSFTQVRTDEQGQTLGATQEGSFVFQRPGQFKWIVHKPYEQWTLSDGKRVYQYDPDLAQVIERDVDVSIGSSPAAILFGKGDLEQAFEMTALPSKEGVDWLRAKPRAQDAGFVHVDIGMQDGLPAALVLLDAFGQTSQITLSEIERNPSLKTDEFQLIVPDGVDVVRM